MRYSILIATLFLLKLPILGQTQLEMNKEAADSLKASEKRLNEVYRKVLKEYSSDTLFIKNFKRAQKSWVQFRNAEMDAKYPHPENYGSIFPMCYSLELQNLTEERIKKLNTWLVGEEEGTNCSGSVKIKSQ